MKRVLSYLCLTALTASAYFLLFIYQLPLGYLINPAQTLGFSTLGSGPWHSVIQPNTNAYFPWRVDRLLLALTRPFATIDNLHAVFVASFIVFACGFTLLLSWIRPSLSTAEIYVSALTLTIALTLRFNEDIVIFQSIAWLPWLSVSTAYALTTQKNLAIRSFALIVVTFIANNLAHGANQLSLVCALIAGLIGWIVADQRNSLERSNQYPPVFTLLICVALFIPCSVALWQTPAPIWPDYPPYSHVVADDGLPGIVQSLIGPEAAIQTIDRLVLTNMFGNLTLVMLAILALVAILAPPNRPTIYRRVFSGTSLLIFALAWDTLLPESMAQIGPLASMARVVPHLIFISLTPLCSALALTGLSLCLAQGRFTVISSYVILLTILPPKSILIREPNPIIVSPSHALIAQVGDWILNRRDSFEHVFFSPPSKDIVATNLSGQIDPTLQRLIDNNESTRWTPGGGKQEYGQGFTVRFPAPVKLYGIELSTGNFPSDFASGLEIWNCDPSSSPPGILAKYPSWQGPIKFTPAGYPYYGGQSEVKIIFEHSATLSCLTVKQIGKRTGFDWSVTELRIAT